MFRKLASNLPFNPSLINQVSFYAKRMHQEQSVRRIGLAMVALAMVLQIFAVVSPPQGTLARVGNDLIPGGAASQGELVNHCNANNYDFATILDYFGIHCQDLFFGQVRTINANDYGGQLYSMGRAPYGKPGETPVNIAGLGTFYMRPLNSWGNANYRAITGTRSDGTPFMVLFDCGNLVIVGRPPTERPQKVVSCANLIISVTPGSRVPLNSAIGVRGQATGDNLAPGELADMYYDMVYMKSGRVEGSDLARGVPFKGNVAEDEVIRGFTVSKPGHYQFRLSVKYFDGGPRDAGGNAVGGCVRDVYVNTPPPTPEKVIECSNLVTSFSNGQKIVAGSNVTVRGQASGRDLPQGELVDMYYDYTDANGKVLGDQKALGVPFKESLAEDNVPRSFKLDKAGKYTFRLSVKYDGSKKSAKGNQTGDCLKVVIVEEPCLENKQGKEATECLILSKVATNNTRNVPNADGTTAQAGDTITYTLATKNTSKNTTVKQYVIKENLIDVLQYADVVNLSGGTMDKYSVVSWPAVDIKPGETINKKIVIKIKNPIPNTPVSTSDPGSYDMKLTNIYGNTVNIKLPPSVTKTTEYVARELPNTGPGETLAGGFMITAIVGYFFARSRLLAKESDILRTEYAISGGM